MNLTWNEIKNLKGKRLQEKSTGNIYEVNSVNSKYIRIGGGIKILTTIFHEIKQKDWEMVIN